MMFKTQRLTFSIIKEADKADVFETLNSKNTADMVSFFKWPMTEDQAEFWCQKSIKGLQSKQEHLFITRHKDKPVGCIGLHLEPNNNQKAETGYWVSENAQGQGLATEMLQGALTHGKQKLGIKTFFATTEKNNPASSKVLMKNNFKEAGTTDVALPNGGKRPSILFELTIL